MNDEVRHDDNLANKADWLEELLTSLIVDIKLAGGNTVHTNTALVGARPGSKKHEMFSLIKTRTGI